MSLKAALSLILPPLLLFCGTAHGQSAATSENAVIGGPVATGGGLYPVKDGRPVSFAEAGYVFKAVESKVLNPDYQTYYKITPETKKALRQVLSELPPVFDLETAIHKIVGDRTAFIRQDQVEAKVLREIQVVYTTVVASFAQKLDPSATVLAAYSKGDKTFILPPFRDDVGSDDQRTPHFNDEQRALNLIHEFKMRGNDMDQSMKEAQARLKRALQLDDLIHTYRHGEKTPMEQLRFILAFRTLAPELVSQDALNRAKNSALARLIGSLEKQLGRPVLFSEIAGRPWEVNWISDPYYADRNLVHDFDPIIPDLSKMLPAFRLYTVTTRIIGETVELKPPTFGNEWYPQAYLSSSMEAVPRRANNSHRAAEVMAEQCQKYRGALVDADIKGNRLMHYDEQFDRVLFSNCNSDTFFLWTE